MRTTPGSWKLTLWLTTAACGGGKFGEIVQYEELSPLAMRTARALYKLSGSRLSLAPTASQGTGQRAGQSMPVMAGGSGQSTVPSAPTVRQALKR
ncbi:hypothetical protein ABVT39_010729 [Epinephelus coioides]